MNHKWCKLLRQPGAQENCEIHIEQKFLCTSIDVFLHVFNKSLVSCVLRPEEAVADRLRGANKILFNHLPQRCASVVRWWEFWRARAHKDGSAPAGDRLQFNTGWFVLLSANLSVAELPDIAFARIRLRTTWDSREESASKWVICTNLCRTSDLFR